MIDSKTIYQVDSFTDEPFKGNPAGVMVVDRKFDSDLMQKIATEMNLSETAFIIPDGDKFGIRYFTPSVEVPLCGHATLASGHIVYELSLVGTDNTINFRAKGGDLSITKESDWIVMNFPEYPLTKMDIPGDFREIIGFEPAEMYSSSYDWKIAVAQTEDDISRAAPGFEMMKSSGLGMLMITAKSNSENFDFVVRCFVPGLGINEDPVTGSAHCALTPLWAEKLGKKELDSLQLSKRTGKLKVKLINGRVEIKGKAITIFKAELKI
ncbi:MAG: PhzF family phenazine biosynthesis protein [Bacteroidales bacterium]|nr:MAG: PhzF family phenazine biosynthesis protein [Bacteroidales bacterium]